MSKNSKNNSATIDPAHAMVTAAAAGDASAAKAYLAPLTADVMSVLADAYELEAPIVSIEPKMGVRGRLIGPGAAVETAEKLDVKTGEIRKDTIGTWIIEVAPGIRIRVLETHQLKSSLPPLVGAHIALFRAEDKTVGKNRVANWVVGRLKADPGAS